MKQESPSWRVHDPSILKAVSHPTRIRILHELGAVKGARSTDLANIMDVTPNLVSFHLRQLAKYHLVEEAPELSRDKREHFWRVSPQMGLSISLEAVASQPGGQSAIQVWKRDSAAWAHSVIEHAYAQDVTSEDIYSIADVPLRLTQTQARQLAVELSDLLRKWVKDGAAWKPKKGSSEKQKTYLALTVLQPYPSHRNSKKSQ